MNLMPLYLVVLLQVDILANYTPLCHLYGLLQIGINQSVLVVVRRFGIAKSYYKIHVTTGYQYCIFLGFTLLLRLVNFFLNEEYASIHQNAKLSNFCSLLMIFLCFLKCTPHYEPYL